MPRFSTKIIEQYIDQFFEQLPETQENQSDRVRGAVCFALLDDQFREEIAEQMEDVKELIEQAEEYIQGAMDSLLQTFGK